MAPTAESLAAHKATGNDAYKAKEYAAAIEAYGKPEYFYEHFTLRHSAALSALRHGASLLSMLLTLATCWWLGLGAASS